MAEKQNRPFQLSFSASLKIHSQGSPVTSDGGLILVLWDRGAALTSRLQSFQTEMLAEEQNFAGLARINRELIAKVEAIDLPRRVVLKDRQDGFNIGCWV